MPKKREKCPRCEDAERRAAIAQSQENVARNAVNAAENVAARARAELAEMRIDLSAAMEGVKRMSIRVREAINDWNNLYAELDSLSRFRPRGQP